MTEPIFVILAGGYGIRMHEWINQNYGDIPKVLLPIGEEQKPILYHNLINCIEIGNAENVYVTFALPEIGDYVQRFNRKINLIREPQDERDPKTNIGRGGALSYCVRERLIPETDIVTVNAVDLCPKDSLYNITNLEGSAFLIARSYFSEVPSTNLPNVVHFNDNGIITHIRREEYSRDDNNTGLHTGISRIEVEYYHRLRDIPMGSETEDTIFLEILNEGRLQISGPIDTWFPLKIPKHARDYENLGIELFREKGEITISGGLD